MKPNELRIGNYYNWDDTDMQWTHDDWRNMEFETSLYWRTNTIN